MGKRPDLRKPMAERQYEPVEKPIIVTVADGFQLPAKEPCKECPLARTATPGALGGYTTDQYVEVLTGPADLACHMSPGFPDDIARQRSCTGVAMFRANIDVMPDGRSALDAVKEVGPNRELVFASLKEFLRHHTASQRHVHNALSARIVREILHETLGAGGGPENVILTLSTICAGVMMILETASKGVARAEILNQVLVEEIPERLAEIRAKKAERSKP